MKKKYTFNQFDIAKKFRRIDGDKVIIKEAKNVDKKTNEISDNAKEKIPKVDLCLKFKKLEAKEQLIKDRLNTAKEEEKKFPNDIVYKLVNDDVIFPSVSNFKKQDLKSRSSIIFYLFRGHHTIYWQYFEESIVLFNYSLQLFLSMYSRSMSHIIGKPRKLFLDHYHKL